MTGIDKEKMYKIQGEERNAFIDNRGTASGGINVCNI